MPIPTTIPATVRRLNRDNARDHIRTAILDGDLTAGERLNEDALILWLGMSRTPIREALQQLTTAGLVSTIPNRSTCTAAPTAEDAADAIDGLRVLARAVSATTADLEALNHVIDRASQVRTATEHDELWLSITGYARHCSSASFARVCTDGLDGLLYRARFLAPAYF